MKLQVSWTKNRLSCSFVAWCLEPTGIESTLHYIHGQTSKTGQYLQCTCAKCKIALFLAKVPCSRSYGYYILYIGVIGRLTKMLEIEIVIIVGMQFQVGFGGSQNAVYRKCVTPVSATRLDCD